MDSIAARTRRAVDRAPFLREALRAGILNYTAAARRLEVDAAPDAVASALRRYEADLPPLEDADRTVRVRMDGDPSASILSVAGEDGMGEGQTALLLSGDLDPGTFGRAVVALQSASVSVTGVGYVADQGVILVSDADGSAALRVVESVLAS